MADITLLRRLALLGVGALALGACDYGLGLSPNPVAPGATVTVTNADDGPACLVEDEVDEAAVQAASTPLEVDIYVITEEPTSEPVPVATVMADDEGVFEATFTAPTRPGQHLVLASCYPELEEDPILIRGADHLEPIDGDGIIVDLLRVGQGPLTLSLSDDEVEVGDEVVATFSLCQAENDLGILAELGGEEPDPELVELATDYPDLAVFVDGVLVDTVETDERYPTGTVDVVLPGMAEGQHEVLGVCTYQTFDLDLEWIFENLVGDGGEEVLELGAAAIDYPVVEEPFTFDQATVQAQGTVNVVAAATAPTTARPNPVVAQPTYTG